MKRIASLFTAAALSAAFLGVATGKSHATTIGLYLVPISPLNVSYKAGDAITFAAQIDIGSDGPGPLSLTVAAGIGYHSNFFDVNGFVDTVDTSSYPTPGPRLWDLVPPPTNSNFPDNLSVFQQAVTHTKHVTQPGNKAVTLAAGTYTVATFTFPVLAGAPTGPTDIVLPTADAAYGFPSGNDDFITNTDANGTNDATLAFPNTGGKYSKLTYNINTGGTSTPAPSSLLVLAGGALPMAGHFLRRRRKPQNKSMR